jgi:nucleoside-diphosphate-sugar epimerase
MNKAVVVGALGVIGRYVVDHLLSLGGWKVVGLSRRAPDMKGEKPASAAQFISVDLLDRRDADAKLSGLTDVTHIVYAAYQARPTWAEHNAPNLAMLVNSVEPIARASRSLESVVLLEGNKWYGSHIGPFKTPARESDPPHMLPNFYWDQETWLRGFQKGKSWSWSALRPHTVCGFALGNPMNLMTCLAVYAAISKELGLPLRFPGKPGAYTSIYQATDSRLLAKAITFCATAEKARNEVFNITNGDFFRWMNVWPRIAAAFDMEWSQMPQTIRLVEYMADKGPLWKKMQDKYGLAPHSYEELAAWPFADYVWGTDYDVMTDTTRIRRAGFHEWVDTEQMIVDLMRQFRAEKIIP